MRRDHDLRLKGGFLTAALLVGACTTTEAPFDGGMAPQPAAPELAEEDGFFYWVDPARCLDPCLGSPSQRLVRVDISGQLDAAGEYSLDTSVQPRLVELLHAAALAGHTVTLDSAFRGYALQVTYWNESQTQIGEKARPGHSEHQIGTAVDIGYETTEEDQWLAQHAFEFGFSMSFTPGAEKLTGIRHEPWHFRYMGESAAREIHDNGWSNVEYLRAHLELARFGDCGDCPDAQSRSACGDLDTAGICDGSVLRFCVDGAAGAVDCALTGLSCSVDGLGDAACQ
jgi:LAS superfamily LD-carboxypeptidase LdcB